MTLSNDRAVVIPDLQTGNLSSVRNMVRKCGGYASVISSPADLAGSSKVILAGVGSFDGAARTLHSDGWADALTELAARAETQILGVCLGFQLMCRYSEEGKMAGLGWINADVRRIVFPDETKLPVPHMGWNVLEVRKPNPLVPAEGEQRFYFAHSYHVVCSDSSDLLAVVNYGLELTAAVSRGNLYGVQFHPEKSHRFGMALMKRFLDL